MELYETIFQAFKYTDYGFGVFLERNHSKEVSEMEEILKIFCCEDWRTAQIDFVILMMQMLRRMQLFLEVWLLRKF